MPAKYRNLRLPAAVAVLVVDLLGQAVLMYSMPVSFANRAGANPGALRYFTPPISRLVPVIRLSITEFSRASLLLGLVGWAAYVAAVTIAYRSDNRSTRMWLVVGGLTAFLLAMVFPPVLSTDAFAYLGFGRMYALQGWSPYSHTLQQFAAAGDPFATIAPVPSTSPYGPVWTALCVAVAVITRGGNGIGGVVTFKLIAAVATVVAAWAGSKIAGRRTGERAACAALAIGLNPLTLIEGAGNGHNDIALVALLLIGLAAIVESRRLVGATALGLSVAVKYVTLTIVPWVGLAESRRRSVGWGTSLLALLLVLLPSAVGWWLFGARGTEAAGGLGTTLSAVQGVGTTTASARPGGIHALAMFGVAALVLAGAGAIYAWYQSRASSLSDWVLVIAPLAAALVLRALALGLWANLFAVVVLFAACTWWLWRREPLDYLLVWPVFALCAIFLLTAVYPWYLIWPTTVALTGWRRLDRRVAAVCIVFSAVSFTAAYALPLAVRTPGL